MQFDYKRKESKEKGFTLLELLAVLVILTSISAMAIPIFSNKGIETKKLVHNQNIKILREQANMYMLENHAKNGTDITEELVEKGFIKEIPSNPLPKENKESKPYRVKIDENGYIKINVNSVVVVGKNKDDEIPSLDPNYEGINKPKLALGMKAIKWNGSSWSEIDNPEIDTSWYDYNNKQWANAISKDSNGDITAYWVWIPRYKYYIPEENYHTNTAGVINIKFEKGIETTGNGEGYGKDESDYLTHPAFTFGTEELSGIWVAKFEASGSISEINILPGKQSLRGEKINDIFLACRNMETVNGERYGWGTMGNKIDTHLIKNIEWGAATYLSNSIYGKEGKVEVNTNSEYYTGGGTSDSYVNNFNQSTTGNEHGIYDMSGGAKDCIASYLDNKKYTIAKYAESLKNSYEVDGSKYVDVYVVAPADLEQYNYEKTLNRKGDAIYETSSETGESKSWYSQYQYFPYGFNHFVSRGGYYSSEEFGGIFAINSYSGEYMNAVSFRPVLLVP